MKVRKIGRNVYGIRIPRALVESLDLLDKEFSIKVININPIQILITEKVKPRVDVL